jgi:1-phosphatidylinositol-4-phosphate 5-kinase
MKEQIVQQLQKDVDFLHSCSVMDYSLLIAIERLRTVDENKGREEEAEHQQRRRSVWRTDFWRRPRRRFNNNPNVKNAFGVSPLSIQYGTNRNGHPERYYLGIIDFLQPYNFKKEVEYRWKSMIYKKNAYSCVPPDIYAQRFVDFIDQNVL